MKKHYILYKKLLSVVAALILSCTAFNALAQDVTVNICPGDTVSFYAKITYTGAKPTYLWKVNGANKPNNTDSVFTYVPTAGDEIVCAITHPCLQPISSPKYIIKEKCDKIFYKTCSGASITFVAGEENDFEISDYQWVVNEVPVFGANDSTYTHTPNPSQIDTVYCIITTDDDCAEPAVTPKYIISYTEPPRLWVSATDTLLCDTVPVIISGNTFGGTASKIDTIKVSGGGGTVTWTKTGTPFDITYTPVGLDTGKTFTLTVITDSVAPCPPAQEIITIHINAKSIIVLNPDISNVCSEEALNFTVTHANITGWTRAEVDGISNPAGSGAGNSVSETLFNTTKATIPVEYLFTINSNGCISTGKAIIMVKPKVAVNAKIVLKKN